MISIVIQSDTTVTVTRQPSWLGRLFGREETTRLVYDASGRRRLGQWVYDEGSFVEDEVEHAIERAFRIRAVRERLVRK